MKNLILPLLLLVSFLGYSQSKDSQQLEIEEVKVQRLDVVVTVDSLEELESTFNLEDIKEMMDLTEDDEPLTFKIICNGELMSNGEKSHMSYKVKGTSGDEETFLKRVEAIRQAAINYYKNK